MKIIKVKNHLTVVLNDGSVLSSSDCTDALYNEIIANQEDEEAVQRLLIPEYFSKKEEYSLKSEIVQGHSNILEVVGDSVYIREISELSVPEDLAKAIYKAEKEENQEALESYMNFWTLASTNPDSRARTNLFWFLNRYGMKISKSGLFVAYRNVELKQEGSEISNNLAKFISAEYTRVKYKLKKSPSNYYVGYKEGDEEVYDNLIVTPSSNRLDKVLGCLGDMYLKLGDEKSAPIYTDSHSRTFTIKIGEVVSMPREECDPVQENTCSKGLHVAGKSWLTEGYFGQHSLMVLVNPADVVAVPPQDSYGKMRVCAYYPVQLIERDEKGQILDQDIEDGFEDSFMQMIAYKGSINNEESQSPYRINIPDIPEINRTNIAKRLQDISNSLKNKVC